MTTPHRAAGSATLRVLASLTLVTAWAIVGLSPLSGNSTEPFKPVNADIAPGADAMPLAPRSAEDLLLIQQRVVQLSQQLIPATVGVSMGGGQGSGVIVSPDGYVLTAAHVNVEPGREVTFILHDGRRVKGKTLGLDRNIDAGLMKITDEGPWPFAPMGNSSMVGPGDWCLAIGHPGGYSKGRAPVVRLGRVISINSTTIQSDCTLVGGDSGGPLFDLDGKVIGIHSRINNSIYSNYHVTVDPYRDTWDRLAAGEAWGTRRGSRHGQAETGTFLGIDGRDGEVGARVSNVLSGSPAERAGLQPGDCILEFNKHRVSGIGSLINLISQRRPGDEVSMVILRGEEKIGRTVVLGSRS